MDPQLSQIDNARDFSGASTTKNVTLHGAMDLRATISKSAAIVQRVALM